MALKWADGNGGVKDVLPTASTDVKGGIKVGQNLYMTAESLNAAPMGGVSFGGGLHFDNGALTFNPLEGLPIGGGLSFVGGTLSATPGVYWGAFPANPQQGCIAFVDDKPYFYDGSDWVPFCQCSQGGDSGSSDPPAGTYVAPQYSYRTVPCTLTLHYDESKDTWTAWNWGYESEGITAIVLPEYVTSRDQITITGANGEIIEPLTGDEISARMDADETAQEEDWNTYVQRYIEFYEANPNAGRDNATLRISETPLGDLATQLRWNHWVNDGNQYSMQINISFNMEVRNIIAGKNSSYGGELYCIDDYGNDFYRLDINTSAGGTAINAQGTPYRDDGYGTLYFDGKPASVVLDEFDPQGVWGLGGLSVNWNEYSGATVLRMDLAGETVEVIRTQHFTDAASHSSAMVVDLPFTGEGESITLDKCNIYSWEQINNNYSRYVPTIENGVLRLYADNGISLIGEIVLGGQDFTIDGIYMACQVSSRPQRIFSMQTAIDKQNGTYTIALVVNQGQMGVHMELAGSSNTNGTSSGAVRQYWHHFAIVYQHEESKAALYIDGVQVETATVTLPATGLSFDIGNSPSIFYNSDAIGWYSHFRVFRGVAVWTDSFTIDVNTVDSMIGGVWRYVNAGDGADMLTTVTALDVDKTKSLTGKAFYGSTSRTANFNVPATPEVWFKFDLYLDSAATKSDRFSFGHYSSTLGGYFGIWNGADGLSGSKPYNEFLIDAKPVSALNTGIKLTSGAINQVLLHMVSGTTSGKIEVTANGATYTYTGNVNNGADFDCLYVYSSTEKILFSNIIISSGQIGFSENLY